MIIINYRIYSSDFAERCKKALESSFGEVPLPESDFAERCKKALESSFGEVPLPECLTNKKKTSRIKI